MDRGITGGQRSRGSNPVRDDGWRVRIWQEYLAGSDSAVETRPRRVTWSRGAAVPPRDQGLSAVRRLHRRDKRPQPRLTGDGWAAVPRRRFDKTSAVSRPFAIILPVRDR